MESVSIAELMRNHRIDAIAYRDYGDMSEIYYYDYKHSGQYVCMMYTRIGGEVHAYHYQSRVRAKPTMEQLEQARAHFRKLTTAQPQPVVCE